MDFFTPDQVRLLPGPFHNAQRVDLRYVLALDPDRLLAPFLREAGLPAKAPSYGNWEDSGLDGHTAGHYLSALAYLWTGTGEPETKSRLEHMVTELAAAQGAVGTGYIGGVPGGLKLFESLRHGDIEIARTLGSGEHWVPWYNLHKLYQGLLDAHQVAGIQLALDVLIRLADWWLDVASTMSDEVFEAMLETEFGGMNEVYADLAALTGRDDYAAMARRFSHRAILDPLLERRDDLTGSHANTQIPKAVGYAATAKVCSDPDLLDAADYFWRTVTERRTVVIGGNSAREHFHDVRDFTAMIEDREGPESCNTYNMLKLTRRLAEHDPRPELFDFAERAMFNHLLSAQHPDRGGFVYFTPMRPRHYRVYSQPDQGFWCCVGTGMEAQTRYGEWTFATHDDALVVNLPIAAQVSAQKLGGTLRLETDFPNADTLTLAFDLDCPTAYPVHLRVPGWCAGLTDLAVNGEPVTGTPVTGGMRIDRLWRPGDLLTYRMPMTLRAERLPDGSPWEAYLIGPVVLAAREGTDHLAGLFADDSRMGHIAYDRLYELADMPILAGGAAGFEQTGPLTFRTNPVGGAPPIDLEPFARIHESRYTIYWPVADPDIETRRASLTAFDTGVALDSRTIDRVQMGEQQPESDHQFYGRGTRTFTENGRYWRTTSDAVAITLTDLVGEGHTLRVGVRLLDRPSAMEIRIDGSVLDTQHFEPGDEFIDLEFLLNELLWAIGHPTSLRIEFRAWDGLPTPGIGMVRLLRWMP